MPKHPGKKVATPSKQALKELREAETCTPQKPGWYWRRHKPNMPKWIMVEILHGAGLGKMKMRGEGIGVIPVPLQYIDGVEWYGPIPNPDQLEGKPMKFLPLEGQQSFLDEED